MDLGRAFALAAARTQPPAATAAPGDAAGARKAAANFESFFLTQAFESMFAGLSGDKLFGGGEGEQVYRTLLLQEYGKVAARTGGLGIAEAVQRAMLQTQEAR